VGYRVHKFDPQNIERLLSKDRLGGNPPEDLLRDSGLSEGMVFADIGCGPGFFTFPAASIVSTSGKVYAVDLQQEMLDELKKRCLRTGIGKIDPCSLNVSNFYNDRFDNCSTASGVPQNVFPVKSEENSIPIKGALVDFTLLAYVLHEARNKHLFLQEVRRIAKKWGKVLVLDWEKKQEDKGPPVEDRVAKEDALELLTDAGFRIIERGTLSPSHWRILAERR
jgi:ubiquinone/menaquinone biosynthesis C-methylase UbiE